MEGFDLKRYQQKDQSRQTIEERIQKFGWRSKITGIEQASELSKSKQLFLQRQQQQFSKQQQKNQENTYKVKTILTTSFATNKNINSIFQNNKIRLYINQEEKFYSSIHSMRKFYYCLEKAQNKPQSAKIEHQDQILQLHHELTLIQKNREEQKLVLSQRNSQLRANGEQKQEQQAQLKRVNQGFTNTLSEIESTKERQRFFNKQNNFQLLVSLERKYQHRLKDNE